MAAQRIAEVGNVAAVVCLGCLIRGATPHFEYIASAVSHGIMAAAAESGVPMAFGVLTTNSVEEALERAAPGPSNKGREAADAALEMARLFATMADGPPSHGFGGTSS
jgi:6,7-dimethyl-8-ribityllumazine synthase